MPHPDPRAAGPRAVAVVGLDCAFPGAAGPEGYWRLLTGDQDTVGEPPTSRFRGGAVGAFLGDADAFDPGFFGIATAEATAMDPQQRLLLQCTWRAVEDSGLPPPRLAGTRTGTYVGAMSDDWARLALADPAGITPRTGTGSGRAMLANRLAYQLDLRGPSMTVDTACSSSLVAVHLACNALLTEECDLALAGGVNLVIGTALDQIYRQSGLAAPDGRCKPFAAEADGIGRGEGIGVVALRRLADALRDGDPVHAVIHGSAVNQDGRSNGIMAPHRASQRDVITAARERAGVRPAQVRYVEAHGTGTALGDLIEVLALDDALGARRGPRERPLALGSVKAAIGHTEGASGMAGLIKAVLALREGTVPPGPAVGKENDRLALAKRSMELVAAPLDLAAEGAGCRVGVSSFGMGGTNAHLVLGPAPAPASAPAPAAEPATAHASESAPEPEPSAEQQPGPVAVFTLSADTPEALRDNLAAQAEAVAGTPARDLAALCRTSNRVRAAQPCRFAAVAGAPEELAAALRAGAGAETDVPAPAEEPSVAFAFTGQGAQYPGMTAGLYAASPLYRRFLDEASEALRPYTVEPVVELILGGSPRVHRTGTTQPALFAVEYALAMTLCELGVRPAAVIGHSIGEFAAAVTAGALDLAGAARLVALRGAFMEALPEGGGMLATRARVREAVALVEREPLTSVAAVNAPGATVLSGDLAALTRLRAELERGGFGCTPLTVSHAFHSPLMEPMLGRFARAASRVPGAVPRLPFHSTVHGGPSAEGTPLDAAYWTAQIPATVRFEDAVGSLCSGPEPPTHIVEIGPKPVLSGLLRRISAARGIPALPVCRDAASDLRQPAEILARLYQDGLDPEWEELYAPGDRRTVRMPAHLFSTRWRSWRQPPTTAYDPATADEAAHGHGHANGHGNGNGNGNGSQANGNGTGSQAQAHGNGSRSGTNGNGSPAGPGPGPLILAKEGAPPAHVQARVREVVAQIVGGEAGELDEDLRFYDDLGFDSVMLMELKYRLETRFPELGELSLPEMLSSLVSIGSLADYVRGLLAPAAV
ncbi:acyltransferase domain-containing protein [Streptomyces sp. NBC_01795]|uniref:type I polyketide synthase n=1 Tax=Streptomyces sp. NBC_01795 TaxID=2975943 RepID=UPI002DD96DA7|nr:beta-ketoacyl synthase N-terminal-like domain-containing protein [Streptomyces sp. NBC_01795]WSA95438.1 acyltransferase domain-containing protein [Streptomyces sp. NBC_01795]